MRAWAIKSGDKYVGNFGRHGTLVEAMFWGNKEELLEGSVLLPGEKAVKVEIKEIKDESVCS